MIILIEIIDLNIKEQKNFLLKEYKLPNNYKCDDYILQ